MSSKQKVPGRAHEQFCPKLGNNLSIVEFDAGHATVFVGPAVPKREGLLRDLRAVLVGYEESHPELELDEEAAPATAKKDSAKAKPKTGKAKKRR